MPEAAPVMTMTLSLIDMMNSGMNMKGAMGEASTEEVEDTI